jgi:hypothetical protein
MSFCRTPWMPIEGALLSKASPMDERRRTVGPATGSDEQEGYTMRGISPVQHQHRQSQYQDDVFFFRRLLSSAPGERVPQSPSSWEASIIASLRDAPHEG